MKNKILKAGLCVGLLMGLTACGNSDSASSETVRLFVSGDASEGGAYSEMAKRYEEETGVKVEVTDVPYADMETKITKAVQSDDAPDVARVSGILPDWGDYLVDLTDIANKGKTLESMTIKDDDGKVRALPTDVTAVGMFINTDLFDQAGVSYPQDEGDIWTWDEFLKAVDTIQEKTDAKYGFVMDPSDHRLRAFTYQFSGQDFVLNEATGTYETDDATKDALQKFIDLNNDGTIPKTVWTSGEDASSMFKSGMIPAYMSGSWQIKDFTTNIKDFNWQAIYMPYETTRATNMGGNFMVGFENSKNSEGGQKFMEWLYTPENYTELCELAGYLPAEEGINVDYGDAQAAYDIYNQEIEAAAQPISSKQTADQVAMTMAGYVGLTGAYKDSMVQALNDEITFDQMIENIEKDYNDGYTMK